MNHCVFWWHQMGKLRSLPGYYLNQESRRRELLWGEYLLNPQGKRIGFPQLQTPPPPSDPLSRQFPVKMRRNDQKGEKSDKNSLVRLTFITQDHWSVSSSCSISSLSAGSCLTDTPQSSRGVTNFPFYHSRVFHVTEPSKRGKRNVFMARNSNFRLN